MIANSNEAQRTCCVPTTGPSDELRVLSPLWSAVTRTAPWPDMAAKELAADGALVVIAFVEVLQHGWTSRIRQLCRLAVRRVRDEIAAVCGNVVLIEEAAGQLDVIVNGCITRYFVDDSKNAPSPSSEHAYGSRAVGMCSPGTTLMSPDDVAGPSVTIGIASVTPPPLQEISK
eukprot:CAMPEP_0119407558 /NCGR_PEP_ID=MMETSP1335-20130426/1410_1 /TAXON_ID=259385 /ORGANISM="Chrysoculter rhomboideus, Strain RCC1486" /LENGTH=172 /DNA_ID=CAMNT_0007431681 /DNA_START=72 /DNA_END=588 /DNA_ORIENTATION=+